MIENLPIKLEIYIFITILFPDLVGYIRKVFPNFLTMSRCQWAFNCKLARQILLERQNSHDIDSRVDLINLMLATNKEVGKGDITAEQQERDNYDNEGFLKRDDSQVRKNRPTTLDEMMGQVVDFLSAGYETTSSALGFTAYELAVNPKVQEKLHQEIDKHLTQSQTMEIFRTCNTWNVS